MEHYQLRTRPFRRTLPIPVHSTQWLDEGSEIRAWDALCRKLLISKDNQLSPVHRHIIKAEDIINRGGGDLFLEIHAPDPNGGVDRSNPVTVPSDACPVTLQPQEHVRLKPG